MIGTAAYPRFGRKLTLPRDQDPSASWNEFNDSLNSIFTSLKSGIHDYFYVSHCHFTTFFYRVDDALEDAVRLIFHFLAIICVIKNISIFYLQGRGRLLESNS